MKRHLTYSTSPTAPQSNRRERAQSGANGKCPAFSPEPQEGGGASLCKPHNTPCLRPRKGCRPGRRGRRTQKSGALLPEEAAHRIVFMGRRAGQRISARAPPAFWRRQGASWAGAARRPCRARPSARGRAWAPPGPSGQSPRPGGPGHRWSGCGGT